MMRYPRVSPDMIPLSNASRKPSLKSFKDDATATTADHPTYCSSEGKTLRSRDHQFPQPCDPETTSCTGAQPVSVAIANNLDAPIKPQSNHDACSVSSYATVGVDRLFQWGSRKRSRGARTESRITSTGAGDGDGDESSPQKKPRKMLRRSSIAAAATAMPPPSCAGGFYTRGSNLRSSLPGELTSRGVEERSVSRTRRLPSPPEKAQKMTANGCKGFLTNPDSKHQPSDQETGGSGTTAAAAEKLNLDHLEWPRINISLSRKEKEDDFLAMKGTKLPHRPKKRAKNIDKTLQYCFPGMWLADLTRGRYEVREKKCVKKKRRGLKGMESSDSE